MQRFDNFFEVLWPSITIIITDEHMHRSHISKVSSTLHSELAPKAWIFRRFSSCISRHELLLHIPNNLDLDTQTWFFSKYVCIPQRNLFSSHFIPFWFWQKNQIVFHTQKSAVYNWSRNRAVFNFLRKHPMRFSTSLTRTKKTLHESRSSKYKTLEN